MSASHFGLDGLVALIDCNGIQADGPMVLDMEPVVAKWRAFGWDAVEVDGHDMAAVLAALSRPSDDSGRPRAVVAHTVKGKGVSFMEDDNNWHYRTPNPQELVAALAELETV